MNPRSSWTLVMIALGLFAFIFFFERHLRTTPPPPGPLLPGLSLPAVTGIQITPEGKDFIRVDRTNGTWQLTHPVLYPIEAQRVRILLQALSALTRQRQITSEQLRTHNNPMEEYGLDSPQFSVTLKQDETEHRLLIGHPTRTGDEVFVRVVGSEGIFLADAGLLNLLPRSADDWRDRALLTLSETAIDGLTVTNGARVMVLGRSATNRNWQMIRPLPARADSARIEKYLRDLLDLRILKFENDDPRADLTPYGLRPASLDLVLTQGTNPPVTISFGRTNDAGQVFVRRRDPPGVVLVEKQPVEAWTLPHEFFRDHRLVQLSEGAVDRLELKSNEPFTLERVSNGVWRVTAPVSLPADPELVRGFLTLLNDLRIQKFIDAPGDDPSRYGFAPPDRTFLLSRSDTNAPDGRTLVAQLEFGAVAEDRDQVYVRRADEPERISTISRKQDDFLQRAGHGWWFRDRSIWNFTTNDVSKLTVRKAGKVIEVFHEPTGGWAIGPGTTGATNRFSSLSVEFTVESLGRLRAYDLWLDHGPDAPLRFGITDKSFSIELELRGEPVGRKLKLSLQPTPASDWPFAATELDGQMFVFTFPVGTFLQLLNCLDPAPGSP